ncbi:MAG TPA: MlaD family protein, partial [Candidatus Acidoferrum sp.]|nr:MlaD family protein [Candidatus Acidoferrum sp.]
MKDSIETRLGLFFALAIITALVIMESLGTFAFFQRGYHLHALFKSVQELKVGDAVKMGGVPVGRVESIRLTNAVARVTMNLDRTMKDQVRLDSTAIIKFTGLMGQNYVDISFGTPTGVPAADGATLPTVEQPDLSALVGRLDRVASGVENLTKSFSGEQIDKLLGPLTELVKNNQSNLTATLGNVKDISERIRNGEGTVGRLIASDDLYLTALNTVSNLQGTAADIKKAADDAHALLTNANDVIAQVKSGQGTLGKIIYDDALHHQAAGAMTNLNQILEKVNKGDGTVSQLINTNSMLKDVKLSLQKLDKATESLEDTGPLSIL